MSDWVSNRIVVRPCSKERAERICEELKKALAENLLGEDAAYGNESLGNLRCHIGMDKETVARGEGELRCRGMVTDWQYDEPEIVIHTETVNEPCVKVVEEFVRHYDPDAAVSFVSVETNGLMFLTNDIETSNLWFVDAFIQPEKGSREEMLDVRFGQHVKIDDYKRMLIEYLGLTDATGMTVADLEDMANESLRRANPDFYLGAYEFEFCGLDECA